MSYYRVRAQEAVAEVERLRACLAKLRKKASEEQDVWTSDDWLLGWNSAWNLVEEILDELDKPDQPTWQEPAS